MDGSLGRCGDDEISANSGLKRGSRMDRGRSVSVRQHLATTVNRGPVALDERAAACPSAGELRQRNSERVPVVQRLRRRTGENGLSERARVEAVEREARRAASDWTCAVIACISPFAIATSAGVNTKSWSNGPPAVQWKT
jgi:hypothetical protein